MYKDNLKENLIDKYLKESSSKYGLIPYIENNIIYIKKVELIDLLNICTVQKTSSKIKSMYNLRAGSSTKTFNNVKGVIMGNLNISRQDIEQIFKEEKLKGSKLNRGNLFEKLVKEFFGQKFHLDNKSYKEAGDIELEGIQYQIKYYRFSA